MLQPSELAVCRRQQVLLLDTLGYAMLLATAGGVTIHRTPALERCVAREPAPDRARLERELAAMVQAVIPGLCDRSGRMRSQSREQGPRREVRTAGSRYRLLGICLGPEVFGEEPGAVLVQLERLGAEPLTREVLRTGFKLTSRQIEVAYLLARGLSNAEIAERLQISLRTVEHHTEQVLRKLSVVSRAAVAAQVFTPDA